MERPRAKLSLSFVEHGAQLSGIRVPTEISVPELKIKLCAVLALLWGLFHSTSAPSLV
jgi:hypothetical protein